MAAAAATDLMVMDLVEMAAAGFGLSFYSSASAAMVLAEVTVVAVVTVAMVLVAAAGS